jgi:hypothetical protein
MLETSLSLVGAFAAYTFYAIAGDEIRANRTAKFDGKRQLTETKSQDKKAPKAKSSRKTSKPKTSPKKTKAVKTEKPIVHPI